MEGLNWPTNEEIKEEEIPSPEPETREDKLKQAERSVRDRFERKLAEVFDTIAENPYFRDLSERAF